MASYYSKAFCSLMILLCVQSLGGSTAFCRTPNSDLINFSTIDKGQLLNTATNDPFYYVAQNGSSGTGYNISPTSPITNPLGGDAVWKFTAPDQANVKVVVEAPRTSPAIINAPALGNMDPAQYFQTLLSSTNNGEHILLPQNTVFNFPASDCSPTSAAVRINNLQDIVLDGNGSRLNINADCTAVTLNNSTRVALTNFTIDYPTLNNTVLATVVANPPNTSCGVINCYTLQIPASAQFNGNVSATGEWDTTTNRWSTYDLTEQYYDTPNASSPFSSFFYFQAYPNNPNYLTVTLPKNPANGLFNVNDTLLVRHIGKNHAITVYNSDDISLETVDLWASPYMGIVVSGGRGLHLNNVYVTRGYHLISSAADAVHISGFSGDVIIENSGFSYQGDDGLNMNTHLYAVAAGTSPVTLPSSVSSGDLIGLFDTNMKFLGTSTAECTRSANECIVASNKLVADVTANGGNVTDLTTAVARFVISNDLFFYNRGRGALIQTPFGLIQNNNFVGQKFIALYLTNSSVEGPGAQDIIVDDNTFSQNGSYNYGIITVGRSAFDSSFKADIFQTSTSPAASGMPPLESTNQNIIFENNTIQNTPGPGFYITSANNVAVINSNSFPSLTNTNFDTYQNVAEANETMNLIAPFVVYDAANLYLSGNTFLYTNTQNYACNPNNSTTCATNDPYQKDYEFNNTLLQDQSDVNVVSN